MFTEEERAEFRQLVARWKAGEKVFDAGKRIEKTDATTVQRQEPIQSIKRNFIAEAQRKHAAETVGPDTRSSYQREQAQAAKQYANQQYQKAKDDAKRAEGMEQLMKTMSPSTYVEAVTGQELGTAGRLITDAAAFGLPGLLKYGAAKAATSPIMQYVRYPIGKIRFGFDAQLPTLYRKVKSLPTIENGTIKISTPQNRFAFENGYGEESPLITNFTTDAPVRSHSAGNWDRGVTLAIPGKKLLGKNVISTRPSDTFTYGNDIQVNVGDVTAITGRQKEIDFLTNRGINTITSDKLKSKFAEDAVKYMQDIAKTRATYPKVFGQKGIVLLKPKTPIEDFSNYAAEVENTSRDFFTSPTLKDYKFMDYVFRPKYTSETIPVYNVSSLESLNQAPQLGEWVGEDTKRMYLLDANRWKNVMYDPSTFAESQFRQGLNIGLKPEYRK